MSIDDRETRPARGSPKSVRDERSDVHSPRLQSFCFLQSMLLALAALLGYLATLQQIDSSVRVVCGVSAILLASAALIALWRLNNRLNEEWLSAAFPRDRR